MISYEEAINALGIALGTTLKPDQHGTCLLKVKSGEEVYAEKDKKGTNLLFGMMIERVPPGKGRERLFQGALIANSKSSPGTLAYSRKADKLLLFAFLPLSNFKGQDAVEHLKAFIEYGQTWREVIRTGRLP
ncbi:MAG: CesT family type III secretion system chaperone [Verrucomicrobia bacterium]|nr:CesT family type III secretion system chaperone [Verrucomicrobiota bacterium]